MTMFRARVSRQQDPLHSTLGFMFDECLKPAALPTEIPNNHKPFPPLPHLIQYGSVADVFQMERRSVSLYVSEHGGVGAGGQILLVSLQERLRTCDATPPIQTPSPSGRRQWSGV
jgi:hypothetical protein